MRMRRGSRGDFWGCTAYPACSGSRPITAGPTPAALTPKPLPRPEVPGPVGAVITDLREAAGHLGRAIDLIRRRQSEIDQLLDERDGITF